MKIAVQSASHNCPIDNSDAFVMPGYTNADVPNGETLGMGRLQEWDAFSFDALGSDTEGPFKRD